jgi:hypothetical protein
MCLKTVETNEAATRESRAPIGWLTLGAVLPLGLKISQSHWTRGDNLRNLISKT